MESPFQSVWRGVAEGDIETIRESVLTGYKDGFPFAPEDAPLLDRHYETVLDFGCGPGRNFAMLKGIGDRVHAFDLPAMVEKCRMHCRETVDLLTADWSEITRHKYDLVFSTLVVQHLDLPVLQSFLADCSRIADRLYLHTRCYLDDGRGNVLATILSLERFDIERCSISIDDALASQYPSQAHFQVLLRTRDRARHRPAR